MIASTSKTELRLVGNEHPVAMLMPSSVGAMVIVAVVPAGELNSKLVERAAGSGWGDLNERVERS